MQFCAAVSHFIDHVHTDAKGSLPSDWPLPFVVIKYIYSCPCKILILMIFNSRKVTNFSQTHYDANAYFLDALRVIYNFCVAGEGCSETLACRPSTNPSSVRCHPGCYIGD